MRSMPMKSNHIYPVFDRLLARRDKEMLLGQRSAVFWFTGLSGSGKTTIAREVERMLYDQGYHVAVLDGDNLRTGLCNNLGFSQDDRIENIRRVAEVARLLLNNGTIVLACFVSPTKAIRQAAAEIIKPQDFQEIHVNTSLRVAESRDPKGLYKKARAGELSNFTGIDAPYEAPENPALSLSTDGRSVEASAKEVMDHIVKTLSPKKD